MQLGINLTNGNWQIINGQLALANYLLPKIQLILSVPVGSWMYDITFGSGIPQLQYQRTNVTADQLKQLLYSAFTPLINNNEVSSVNITCTFQQIGVYQFDVDVVDISGNYFKFNYTYPSWD